MKKIIGAAAALAAVGVVAVAPAQAAIGETDLTWKVTDIQANPAFYNTVVVQQITDYEATVLSNLTQGVTIDGIKYGVTGSASGYYNDVYNYLHVNAYSDAQINQLNNIINKGRALIINNVDTSVLDGSGSLSNLRAALPLGTQSTLLDLAAQAQTILAGGSDVLQAGTTLTTEEAQRVCDAREGNNTSSSTTSGTARTNGTSAAGSVVRATGADYTANLAVFAGLVVASVGVAFVGKKYSTKIGLF